MGAKRTGSITAGVFTILGTAALLLALNGARSYAEGEGTTAAPFLQIGTSARAEAMGGAFSSVADDVDAIYWNPAGLSQLRRSMIGLTHLEWFEGIRYEYLSYADKFDAIGAIGVSVGYFYLGDIPKTVETLSGDFDEANSTGTFNASDLALGLAWAGSLFARENKIGVGVKLIQEHIDNAQSFGIGLDVGDQFLLSKSRWYRKAAEGNWAVHLVPGTVALAVRNLGTPVKYTVQNDPLPTVVQAGLAYEFFNDDLNAALDAEYELNQSRLVLRAGAEYWIRTGGQGAPLDFALRAGWRSGYDAGSAPGFSLGGGVVYSGLGLDYVFMPFGDLGSTHRVSLKYAWGDILRDKAVKKHHTVKKEVNASEAALQETAEEMVKVRKTMEEKVVVRKATPTKRTIAEVEAKKPGEPTPRPQPQAGEGAVRESETAGAATPVAKTPVLPTTGSRLDSAALIAQITRNSRMQAGASRTQSQYLRRTSDDAIRAARREAERKSMAFDEVENAAQTEAKRNATEQMVTKTTVYFAKNSDALNDKYLYALDQIAISFDRNPQRTILVHGYAADGEPDANNLSLRRAKAVKDYLVQIKSISGNKISLKGFGDKNPAADNGTDRGRALNRRVRVQIIRAGN